MDAILTAMSRFSAAEEFLEFLGIDYEQAAVNVHRLHILKRFQQYLRREPVAGDLDEEAARQAYKLLLERAYGDFLRSDAATEKVFKVFQDAAGVGHVSADSLAATLTTRRARTA